MKNGYPESRDEFFELLVHSIDCRMCRFQEICNKADEDGDGPRTEDSCKHLLMKIYDKAESEE